MSWFDKVKDTVSGTVGDVVDNTGQAVTGWWENEVQEFIGESPEGNAVHGNPEAVATQPNNRDREIDQNTGAVASNTRQPLGGFMSSPMAIVAAVGLGALVLVVALK